MNDDRKDAAIGYTICAVILGVLGVLISDSLWCLVPFAAAMLCLVGAIGILGLGYVEEREDA